MMMTKRKAGRLVSILATLVFTLALAGCGPSGQNGSNTSPAETVAPQQEAGQVEAKDLVVKESGFTVDNGYVHYAVAIENPNASCEPDYAVISIVGTDEDENIVFSDDWTVSHLPCGTTTYWANQAGNGKVTKDVKVEFSVSVDTDGWQEGALTRAGMYKIDKVKFQKDGTSSSVTGTIALTADAPSDEYLKPMLVAIFKDADGKLLNGEETYVDAELKTGKSTAFEMSCYHAPSSADSVEVYANPW